MRRVIFIALFFGSLYLAQISYGSWCDRIAVTVDGHFMQKNFNALGSRIGSKVFDFDQSISYRRSEAINLLVDDGWTSGNAERFVALIPSGSYTTRINQIEAGAALGERGGRGRDPGDVGAALAYFRDLESKGLMVFSENGKPIGVLDPKYFKYFGLH